jgi:Domain of unknown function (DUF222)
MDDHDDRFEDFRNSHDVGDPAQAFAGMSDSEVEHALLELRRHLNITSVMLHHAVAEFDRRQVAEREYVLSTRQWLSRYCRISASGASRAVSTARAMDVMPQVAKAAAMGDITPEAVDRLAAAHRQHPEDFPLHEPVFADIASHLGPKDLRIALEHWKQQVEHHDGASEAAERRSRRRLSISQTFEGMWHQAGLLDPDSGHVVSTTLRTLADPANLDPDDQRTHAQRMADAAVDVCKFWLDHNDAGGTSGGVEPHVTVTVEYDALVAGSDRIPEIDGTPVDRETMRRLLCDAGITRIVLDGEGQPLDVGRTVRTVTPAIRRALDVRDGGCTWTAATLPRVGAMRTTSSTGRTVVRPPSPT